MFCFISSGAFVDFPECLWLTLIWSWMYLLVGFYIWGCVERKNWTLPPTACRGKWVGSENCTLTVIKHWIWKRHNISIYICISQCKTLRKWVVTFDVFRLLKHFLKLNAIVAMGLCEHDVMLSKHGRLSTGIKMPGVVLQLSLVDLKTSTK